MAAVATLHTRAPAVVALVLLVGVCLVALAGATVTTTVSTNTPASVTVDSPFTEDEQAPAPATSAGPAKMAPAAPGVQAPNVTAAAAVAKKASPVPEAEELDEEDSSAAAATEPGAFDWASILTEQECASHRSVTQFASRGGVTCTRIGVQLDSFTMTGWIKSEAPSGPIAGNLEVHGEDYNGWLLEAVGGSTLKLTVGVTRKATEPPVQDYQQPCPIGWTPETYDVHGTSVAVCTAPPSYSRSAETDVTTRRTCCSHELRSPAGNECRMRVVAHHLRKALSEACTVSWPIKWTDGKAELTTALPSGGGWKSVGVTIGNGDDGLPMAGIIVGHGIAASRSLPADPSPVDVLAPFYFGHMPSRGGFRGSLANWSLMSGRTPDKDLAGAIDLMHWRRHIPNHTTSSLWGWWLMDGSHPSEKGGKTVYNYAQRDKISGCVVEGDGVTVIDDPWPCKNDWTCDQLSGFFHRIIDHEAKSTGVPGHCLRAGYSKGIADLTGQADIAAELGRLASIKPELTESKATQCMGYFGQKYAGECDTVTQNIEGASSCTDVLKRAEDPKERKKMYLEFSRGSSGKNHFDTMEKLKDLIEYDDDNVIEAHHKKVHEFVESTNARLASLQSEQTKSDELIKRYTAHTELSSNQAAALKSELKSMEEKAEILNKNLHGLFKRVGEFWGTVYKVVGEHSQHMPEETQKVAAEERAVVAEIRSKLNSTIWNDQVVYTEGLKDLEGIFAFIKRGLQESISNVANHVQYVVAGVLESVQNIDKVRNRMKQEAQNYQDALMEVYTQKKTEMHRELDEEVKKRVREVSDAAVEKLQGLRDAVTSEMKGWIKDRHQERRQKNEDASKELQKLMYTAETMQGISHSIDGTMRKLSDVLLKKNTGIGETVDQLKHHMGETHEHIKTKLAEMKEEISKLNNIITTEAGTVSQRLISTKNSLGSEITSLKETMFKETKVELKRVVVGAVKRMNALHKTLEENDRNFKDVDTKVDATSEKMQTEFRGIKDTLKRARHQVMSSYSNLNVLKARVPTANQLRERKNIARIVTRNVCSRVGAKVGAHLGQAAARKAMQAADAKYYKEKEMLDHPDREYEKITDIKHPEKLVQAGTDGVELDESANDKHPVDALIDLSEGVGSRGVHDDLVRARREAREAYDSFMEFCHQAEASDDDGDDNDDSDSDGNGSSYNDGAKSEDSGVDASEAAPKDKDDSTIVPDGPGIKGDSDSDSDSDSTSDIDSDAADSTSDSTSDSSDSDSSDSLDDAPPVDNLIQLNEGTDEDPALLRLLAIVHRNVMAKRAARAGLPEEPLKEGQVRGYSGAVYDESEMDPEVMAMVRAIKSEL